MKKNIKRMINLMDCAEKTKIELVNGEWRANRVSKADETIVELWGKA
jgi:hypothetical protein